ncbi:MAG: hypothetical protein M3R46_17645, partial [Actinomycetota bacterium]|nr:hypothetical protein [Actinomycetota bacterium]
MKRRRSVVSLLFVVVCASTVALSVLQSASANHADFNVTRFDDPAPDGCLVNGCSLREAIIAAEANPNPSTVHVPAGPPAYSLTRAAAPMTLDAATAMGTANDPAVGDLDIRTDVTVSGDGSGQTIIDAGGIDRVFDISTGATLKLHNLNVRNGRSRTGFVGHDHGGAIHNHGSLTMTQGAVSGSAVADSASTLWGGGGLTNAGGAAAVLKNVTFSQNATANALGGAIENGGTARLFNVTVAGNTSMPGRGAGIANGGGAGGIGFFASGTVRVNNTLLSSNTGGNCSGVPLTSVGHNISSDSTCAGLTGTGDQTSTTPAMTPVTDSGGYIYLYALTPGPPPNPAVDRGSGPYDAGTDIGCEAVDQRGMSRPQDG